MSDAGGRTALGAFFLLMAVGGAALLAGVLGRVTIAEWRANHEFVEAKCTVVAKRVAQIESDGVVKYRPEATLRYHVGGRDYESAAFDAAGVYFTDEESSLRALEPFAVGGEYPCWFDPQKPESAVLVRGYSWYAWVIPLLPAAFIAVGIGGLIYLFLTWGKSDEHRSLLNQSNRDLFDAGSASRRRYPTVPDDTDISSSPGTVLRYRVPGVPVIGSFLITALALAWNIATAWFVIRAIIAFFAGRTDDYVYSPLLLPFVGAGGYLAYLAGRELLSSVGLEPTVVEISDHPLFAGEQYELYVSQAGRMQFNRLTVSLVCDEEATYRQGTNSRTHVQRVFETELFRRESFATEHRAPLAERFTFRVPAGAMHSFQSTHNGVKWKLAVTGVLHKWPDFEREFSLIVMPGKRGVLR